MTYDLFYENYLNYNRDVRIAVGQEIDIDTNTKPVPPVPPVPPEPIIPSNEIWYVSTDGNIVTPHASIPGMTSNTYVDGKGIIVFENDVTSIPEWGFQGCTTLRSISLSDAVTTISNGAFNGCTGLESILIPVNTESIGNWVFVNCNNLTSVVWKTKNCNTGSLLPTSVSSITFGNEVEVIPDQLCYNMSITSLVIPDSVTTIGWQSFANCAYLTSVKFGNGLISIGDEAFYGCSALTSVKLQSGTTTIGNTTFGGCNGATSIMLPETIESIGSSAFNTCDSLQSFTIQAIVPPTIGEYAFKWPLTFTIYVPAEVVDTYKSAEGWSVYASIIQAI